jgi:hypothetical protein
MLRPWGRRWRAQCGRDLEARCSRIYFVGHTDNPGGVDEKDETNEADEFAAELTLG